MLCHLVAKRRVDAIGLRCRRVIESDAAIGELIVAPLVVVDRPARSLATSSPSAALLSGRACEAPHRHEHQPDVPGPAGPTASQWKFHAYIVTLPDLPS